MKSFTAITAIALATSAIARPDNKLRTRQSDTCIVDTTSTGNPSDIQASINQWNNDVNAVNSFLNTALSLDSGSLGSAASSALLNAQDEPCQLATLSSAGASDGSATDAFTCAVSDLEAVFGDHVITNLNTIISNPSDTAAVHAAVGDINFFRCCNVLPDADLLWLDSAADNGLVGTVPITAGRPDACSSTDCSSVSSCRAKDNGSFGK